ncbi:MAG: 3-deoxy-manno-octulosonate cytidylyltransferase [Bacteroidetes bacterium]|nr:3-deoxy-manno-octulosonate cytidylyltransferase [Bacteroidota bacterium]
MKTLGIIPARYASTRFPGKPLAVINGKSMIERVYEQALKAELLYDVIVATDDDRIFDHVKTFGGKVTMTASNHLSGTDRCAEVLNKSSEHYELVINIQGDEPYIHPGQIDLLINCFKHADAQIATLVRQITDAADLDNVNLPKVVRQLSGYALYFSRSPIPYCNEKERAAWVNKGAFFKHIGIYGFRSSILPLLAKLPPANLEMAESLEQLRWLENGFRIITAVSDHENLAVDTPGDIVLLEQRFGLNT